jgi:trimethylamine:corrinoid methyltransferase-like protein
MIMKPLLKYLSYTEIEMIHREAIKILSSLVMRLSGEKAFRLMEDAGDENDSYGVFKIPGDLVANAIKKAAKRDQVTLFGRKPKHDISFDDNDSSFACR